MKIMLVYQGGLANVFKVDCFNLGLFGRNAKRLYQGTFNDSEMVVYGLSLGGATIHIAGCNRAGDISEMDWTEDLDNLPFSDKFKGMPLNTNSENTVCDGEPYLH
jgi:hypothetical protein